MTKRVNTCAYCHAVAPFTKEHIWPKALIQKYESLRTFSPKTNRFYTGDAVIKDVCEKCNNEKLSPIDTYLSKLFDQSFKRILEPGEAVQMQYDYDLLLRGLLKISYNSARASSDAKTKVLLAKFSNFIAHGGYHPKVMLRLQVVTSSRALNVMDGSESQFRPEFLRCGSVTYDGPLSHRFCIRLVAINSFWFYLIAPFQDESSHKWDELLHGLLNWITPTGILVRKGPDALTIPKEQTTFLHPNLLGSLRYAENT